MTLSGLGADQGSFGLAASNQSYFPQISGAADQALSGLSGDPVSFGLGTDQNLDFSLDSILGLDFLSLPDLQGNNQDGAL